jgi:SPOR domain
VRPDGTLVTEPAPETVAEAPQADVVPADRPEASAEAAAPNAEQAATATEVAAAPQAEAPAANETALAAAETLEPAQTPVAEAPVAEAPAAEAPAAPRVKKQAQAQTAAEEAPRVPTPLDDVPSRPSDQPLNVVNGEQQVASAESAAPAEEAAPVAPAAGEFVMQIASQPTEEAALSSLQSLSRKYANVLGGRGYTIQKAQVEGKGTFYRVRIAAGSRADANKLCSSYKSAGGSCFVTR